MSLSLFQPQTLYRFLAKHFLLVFVSVYAGVAALIGLIEGIELIRRFSGRATVSLQFLAGLALMKVPTLLEKLFPFLILVSLLMTLGFLSRRRELVACRLAGLSFRRIALPFLLSAAFLRLFDLAVLNPLGANCLMAYERQESRLLSGNTDSFSVSDHGLWIQHSLGSRHVILRINSIRGETLCDLTLFEYDAGFDLTRQIRASTALFQNGELVLSRAHALQNNGEWKRVSDIHIPSPLTLSTLKKSGRSPGTLSLWNLPQFIDILEKSGLSSARYRLHGYRFFSHTLLTFALVFMTMGLLFFPFKKRIFSMPWRVLITIGSGFFLFFIDDMTWALGLSGRLPLWFAAFSPAFMAAMLGAVLILNLEELP